MTYIRQWECPVPLSKKEKLICNKLKTHGKLFVFLRNNRHLIFDEKINQQLIAMYADHPKGKPPVPAAQLAMATLLQSYEQKSDAGSTAEPVYERHRVHARGRHSQRPGRRREARAQKRRLLGPPRDRYRRWHQARESVPRL